eukprot:CAMPEP_0119471448 /NCGR_PEP_ID=MMETSP1344-20130328/3909_1 /TAXON_ID=236787 /ORGANISM="Florenciella parvula, Strain CCMP2471" /LENGTH=110 /DNA_ID=CAMNT_0007504231 /DNA_START=163 /DNA_END=492 /DNA_ORIENTATION=+
MLGRGEAHSPGGETVTAAGGPGQRGGKGPGGGEGTGVDQMAWPERAHLGSELLAAPLENLDMFLTGDLVNASLPSSGRWLKIPASSPTSAAQPHQQHGFHDDRQRASAGI